MQTEKESNLSPVESVSSWKDARLLITDYFESPPVIIQIDDSIIGTLGNFSASTGKAKSKKTFNICAIVSAALTNSTILNYTASLPAGKNKILFVDRNRVNFTASVY